MKFGNQENDNESPAEEADPNEESDASDESGAEVKAAKSECPVCGSMYDMKDKKKVRTIEDLEAVAQAILKKKSTSED